MKKLILLFIIICAALLADKVYLVDGQTLSGTLDVIDGDFVLAGRHADVTFHDEAIDAVEKGGVKYTPEQYVAALENASEYTDEDYAEYEDADDEYTYEYVEETVEYGFDALSLHDKIKLYELEKLDKNRAAALALTLPLMGHNYAGDTARGFAIFLGKFIVPVFMASAVPVDTEAADGGQAQKDVQIGVGVLTFGIMQLWEIFDAMGAVEDHNAALRARLGIEY
ncbi:hypothetical protein NO1_1796 [Candidatus Termititenax aidoneus]|uniref:Uncharacterized protein n=1 Tax=Termititenax aidoneus TaxID=2218524 RepID=A0A388TDA3_TERA1|nr:hypothetical protein NO1_1796 [Candidatus Termititenax aidoneus]